MAWDGYEDEPEPEPESGVGYFIMIGLGLFFLLPVFIALTDPGYEGNDEGIKYYILLSGLLGGVLTFIALKGLITPDKGVAARKIKKHFQLLVTRKNQKHIQLLATEFLEKGYSIWTTRGLQHFEAAMEQAVHVDQLLWKQIVFWPEEDTSTKSKSPSFVSPSFSNNKSIHLAGYVSTPQSLMVLPAHTANISRASIWQSQTESDPVELNLFETASHSASESKDNEAVVMSGLDQLSCIELYFADMITAEYLSTNGRIGQLKVTLRDGRSITLQSNPEVTALVREAIRTTKGVTPGIAPTPTITPDENVRFGTAFFASEDGYLITCHHVIKDAKEITIVLSDGTNLPARIVQADKVNDVALLKTDTTSKALPVSDSSHLTKGEEVFTLGYPHIGVQGQEQKATFGRVNSVSGIQDDIRFIQIDVPIQPGNSGGPLIDSKGQVVGIVTSTLDPYATLITSGSIPQNVNYAIKADYFLPLVRNLGGKLKEGPAERQITNMSDAVRDSELSVALVLAK
jgi:S1-C subfamily serine protease